MSEWGRIAKIVMRFVANAYGVSVSAIVNYDRHYEIADARHMASALLQAYGLRPRQAAEALNRNRVTMIHSRHRYDALYSTDKHFRAIADRVNERIANEITKHKSKKI